jgi:hypothetical protein
MTDEMRLACSAQRQQNTHLREQFVDYELREKLISSAQSLPLI